MLSRVVDDPALRRRLRLRRRSELAQQPDASSAEFRIERELVYEIGPSGPAHIAEPQQASGDQISVDLISDKHIAEAFAS